MYYITVSIIVILCGGYVSGECNHVFYTNPTVNAPIGKCLLLYNGLCNDYSVYRYCFTSRL